MIDFPQFRCFFRPCFNTLAQTGTIASRYKNEKQIITVYGNGSDAITHAVLLARHKKKIITQKIVLSLIDVAKKKKQPERIKEYWNTYYCLNQLYNDGKRVYGKYCKNRICPICSGNRKAELINKYLPVVNKWSEPYFVTLTIKSVPAKKLREMIQAVNRGLRLIIGKYKKRNQRNKEEKLIGVKSLECNFNPIKKTYNPHFHLIVPDERTASIIVKEWLYYCNRKGKYPASPKAQHTAKVYNNETCMIEVIKYGSKIFTLPENEGQSAKVYIAALNNILTAMKGVRLFDRFGFNTPLQKKERKVKTLTDYDKYLFDPVIMNWLNPETNLKITDEHSLSEELQRILNNHLDIALE